MLAQDVAVFGLGAEHPPESTEPSRNWVICALVTEPRSAWVIWPSFSSRLIRDSRSLTRVATGWVGSWYGSTAALGGKGGRPAPTNVDDINSRTAAARNGRGRERRTGFP